MDPIVLVALIGAIPGALGAWAAVLAAQRAGSSDTGVREIKAILENHVKDATVHYLPDRRIVPGGKDARK